MKQKRNKSKTKEKDKFYNSFEEEEFKLQLRNISGDVANVTVSKGLYIVIMPDDGNCLFHSIADQFVYLQLETQDSYADVRSVAVTYIANNKDYFLPFKEDEDESMEDYIIRMR